MVDVYKRQVAGHGHKTAFLLEIQNELQLVLGLGFGKEVVHPRLRGDGLRGEAVVARDHHGLDAHGPDAVETIAHTGLDHVLELDDAEHAPRGGGHHQRRTALTGDVYKRQCLLRTAFRPKKEAR